MVLHHFSSASALASRLGLGLEGCGLGLEPVILVNIPDSRGYGHIQE